MKLQKIGRMKSDRQRDEAELSPSRPLLAIQSSHRLPYKVEDSPIGRVQERTFDRGARDGVMRRVVRTFRQATETQQAVYGVILFVCMVVPVLTRNDCRKLWRTSSPRNDQASYSSNKIKRMSGTLRSYTSGTMLGIGGYKMNIAKVRVRFNENINMS